MTNAAASYAALVGVASIEVPSLQRVTARQSERQLFDPQARGHTGHRRQPDAARRRAARRRRRSTRFGSGSRTARLLRRRHEQLICDVSVVASLLVGCRTRCPRGASAEPYLAVESGLKCANCHVNPSGGGKRNAVRHAVRAQSRSRRSARLGEGRKPWTGDVVSRWFAVGGDFRGGYSSVDIPGFDKQSETDVSRATVYAEFRALPNLLSLYVDQKIAPDDSENREAYLLLTPRNGKFTVKAGQMFVPFGLRLQDDNAFVRQATGVNFLTPDDGVEVGLELAKWSTQARRHRRPGGRRRPDQRHGRLRATEVARRRERQHERGRVRRSRDAQRVRRPQDGADLVARGDELHLGRSAGRQRDSTRRCSRAIGAFRKGHNLKVDYEYLEPNAIATRTSRNATAWSGSTRRSSSCSRASASASTTAFRTLRSATATRCSPSCTSTSKRPRSSILRRKALERSGGHHGIKLSTRPARSAARRIVAVGRNRPIVDRRSRVGLCDHAGGRASATARRRHAALAAGQRRTLHARSDPQPHGARRLVPRRSSQHAVRSSPSAARPPASGHARCATTRTARAGPRTRASSACRRSTSSSRCTTSRTGCA